MVGSISNNFSFIKTVDNQKYDFNNDGKITVEDYNLAKTAIEKGDTELSLDMTQEELEAAFIAMNSKAIQTQATQNNEVASPAVTAPEETQETSAITDETIPPVDDEIIPTVVMSTEDDLALASYGELRGKLNEISNIISVLEDQQIRYQEAHAGLQADFEAKQKEYDRTKKLYEADLAIQQKEEEELKKLKAEYDAIVKQQEDLNYDIEDEAASVQSRQNSLIEQAALDYNPQVHGDNFQTYANGVVSASGIGKNLDNLNEQAKSLQNRANDLGIAIENQQAKVQSAAEKANVTKTAFDAAKIAFEASQSALSLNENKQAEIDKNLNAAYDEYNNIQSKMASYVDGAGLSIAEVLASVPQEEKALFAEVGANIKDYMLAKGTDGNFHFYVANQNSEKFGCSLTLLYRDDHDIAKKMEGFHIFSDSEMDMGAGAAATAVYKLTSVNPNMTDGTGTWDACMYSFGDPLAFDIEGDGFNTTEEKISYDIDGDGKKDIINNVNEWILAFDKDKDGIAGKDASELFGDSTDFDGDGKADGYKNGFEALKALAEKEGLVGGNDHTLDENDLEILSKKFGLTMTRGYGGESKSLASLGITEINLATTDKTTTINDFDNRGNNLMQQEGATFTVNGKKREYADIWNASISTLTQETENVLNKTIAKESEETIKLSFLDLSIARQDDITNPFVYTNYKQNNVEAITRTVDADGKINEISQRVEEAKKKQKANS